MGLGEPPAAAAASTAPLQRRQQQNQPVWKPGHPLGEADVAWGGYTPKTKAYEAPLAWNQDKTIAKVQAWKKRQYRNKQQGREQEHRQRNMKRRNQTAMLARRRSVQTRDLRIKLELRHERVIQRRAEKVAAEDEDEARRFGREPSVDEHARAIGGFVPKSSQKQQDPMHGPNPWGHFKGSRRTAEEESEQRKDKRDFHFPWRNFKASGFEKEDGNWREQWPPPPKPRTTPAAKPSAKPLQRGQAPFAFVGCHPASLDPTFQPQKVQSRPADDRPAIVFLQRRPTKPESKARATSTMQRHQPSRHYHQVTGLTQAWAKEADKMTAHRPQIGVKRELGECLQLGRTTRARQQQQDAGSSGSGSGSGSGGGDGGESASAEASIGAGETRVSEAVAAHAALHTTETRYTRGVRHTGVVHSFNSEWQQRQQHVAVTMILATTIAARAAADAKEAAVAALRSVFESVTPALAAAASAAISAASVADVLSRRALVDASRCRRHRLMSQHTRGTSTKRAHRAVHKEKEKEKETKRSDKTKLEITRPEKAFKSHSEVRKESFISRHRENVQQPQPQRQRVGKEGKGKGKDKGKGKEQQDEGRANKQQAAGQGAQRRHGGRELESRRVHARQQVLDSRQRRRQPQQPGGGEQRGGQGKAQGNAQGKAQRKAPGTEQETEQEKAQEKAQEKEQEKEQEQEKALGTEHETEQEKEQEKEQQQQKKQTPKATKAAKPRKTAFGVPVSVAGFVTKLQSRWRAADNQQERAHQKVEENQQEHAQLKAEENQQEKAQLKAEENQEKAQAEEKKDATAQAKPVPVPETEAEGPATHEGAAPDAPMLVVVSARYCALGDPTKGADVTHRIRSLIKHNRLDIRADNATFGDPVANQLKQLVIQYQEEGSTDEKGKKSMTVKENEACKLENVRNAPESAAAAATEKKLAALQGLSFSAVTMAATKLQAHYRRAQARRVMADAFNERGLLLAMPGTVQGQSGWYQTDLNGQLMAIHFEINDAGEWAPGAKGAHTKENWLSLQEMKEVRRRRSIY